ncbi:sorbosone dehydrogenase [Rhodanobacter thiooxydans]|uniref:Sorbosone dehydrogenase n=1 Tax=Rhodanobacter thiooxydans TaxID=416169 RepID=A0A154QLM0_9GAMM|nr:PQQ-dependent sugar dehydrogenase [Rhodanobacter thiooxydans]EIL97202.1 L-sorbosone dehydrogenase [Rhodanobacter thiooxydans LCS2]KZC25099.1 sorbosone dehydrogenase [Rhodanobacter thiooxydans]MCW0203808.1 PQQ-dependent sugar dehydrogenase [Rhodanobacter thiooxydans]
MRLLLPLLLVLSSLPALAAPPPLDRLTLPKGFHIAVYSDQVPDARELALGAKGTVFVGSNDAGKVYALTDTNGDGVADRVRVVASGLQLPVGVAFKGADLYVSAVSRIYVLRDIENHLDDPPQPAVVTDKLPSETHHGWKFIAFGPDGKLYVPIGAPCNICDPAPAHGKLIRMNADGSGWQDVAHGIRNSVGFDWQPGTKRLWFTDNGRDLMGDDMPSDELNEITGTDQHFGYPYCHQGDTLDPEFGKGHRCKDYVPPVLKLGAHVGALGMRFYEGRMFPPGYRGAILVAEHGSWNRTKKSGYRVMTVRLSGSKVVAYEPLITGFEQNESAWGRPVDVQPLPDGSLLVSDDLAGAVYRVTYKP